MFGWFRLGLRTPSEEQRQVARALSDYPPYAPPEWDAGPDVQSQGDASRKYQEYFFSSRQARLEALSAFLARFDVQLNLGDAGLMAVSSWLPRYADLLVDDFDDDTTRNAYACFAPSWTGRLSGLNPIFDLGIYYAEGVWARRTKLKWTVVRTSDSGWSTHFIWGLPDGKPFDPISWMYAECRNIRVAKRVPYSDNSRFLRTDGFYRHLLSNAPSGRRSRKGKTAPVI